MSQRAMLLWAVVIATSWGCSGRNAPPAETAAGEAPPPDVQPQAGGPTPSIDVERLVAGTAPATTGLPARNEDQVAVALTAGDGGRGNPNLTIQLLAIPDGRQVDEMVVLEADEVDAMTTEALIAAIEPRARHAEQVLAEGGFVPLELIGQELVGPRPESAVRLVGAGLWVGFDEGHLVVRQEAGPVRLDEDIATPSTSETAAQPPNCQGPPVLLGAWVDAGRSLIVARLIDAGAELCGEPDDWYAVRMLGPGDTTYAFSAESTTVDCAQIGDRAYRARLVAAGVDVEGIECGEQEDRPR